MNSDRRMNKFVGCAYDKNETRILRDLLKAHGIETRCVTLKSYTGMPQGFSLYCVAGDMWRAREIKRGFKTALQLRGDVFDFMLGMRAGLSLRKERDGRTKRLPGISPTEAVASTIRSAQAGLHALEERLARETP